MWGQRWRDIATKQAKSLQQSRWKRTVAHGLRTLWAVKTSTNNNYRLMHGSNTTYRQCVQGRDVSVVSTRLVGLKWFAILQSAVTWVTARSLAECLKLRRKYANDDVRFFVFPHKSCPPQTADTPPVNRTDLRTRYYFPDFYAHHRLLF